MAYIAKLSNSGGVKSLTRYVSALAGNAAFVDSSYESIATTTVGSGGAASVTFSSIPATYQHLQVRALSSNGTGSVRLRMRLNSDSGNNYAVHALLGDGASVYSVGFPSTTPVNQINVGANTSTTGNFGGSVIDILDYANTNKNKTTRTLAGIDTNGAGQIEFWSGLWLNTNAVSSISLYFDAGIVNQYSSFALYGIKG